MQNNGPFLSKRINKNIIKYFKIKSFYHILCFQAIYLNRVNIRHAMTWKINFPQDTEEKLIVILTKSENIFIFKILHTSLLIRKTYWWKTFHYCKSLLLLKKLIPLELDSKTLFKTSDFLNQVQQLRAQKYFTMVLWTAALSSKNFW